MKLSRNWLEKFLKVSYSNGELGEMLTTIGLEVEGLDFVESIKGGLQGVIVGHVIACEPHPDADKLKVTTVDIGDDDHRQIVCGAPNVAKGQKVLVATVGTTLYNGSDAFKIKKAKIRGVESHGMICAEDELGLGASHDGIMVLPNDTKVGQPAAELFDMTTDSVFDIGLTPNRSDATSQFGVAQDLYAYLKVNKSDELTLKEPQIGGFQVNNVGTKFKVEINDIIACPRYSGLVIDNIVVKESPDWIKKLLNSIGVKSINNVVDVTNYVLHEMGQPLHAFDASRITDNTLIIKKANQNQEFLALDERTIKLNANDLMICDINGEGLCIAGVFGGKDSGVTESTTSLFLESAYFEPGHIRRTSMSHNLRTDAAKVFEKGADPNLTIHALKRAAMLICELTGGVVSSEIIDEYPKVIKPVEVRLRYSKINEIIGQDIEEDIVHNILNAMNMEISPMDEESIIVKVPTNKFDVTREIDLIEEILRIYGFNNIPIPNVVKSSLNYSSQVNKNEVKNSIGDYLAAQGFNEMMGLSLMESRQVLAQISIEESSLIYINNTSNIHLDVLRPDALISGALSILHNINRQQTDVKLFEFGKTYEAIEEGFKEKELFTIFITGITQQAGWNQPAKLADYYSIKSAVHNVLLSLGIEGYQVSENLDDRFKYGLKYHRGPDDIVNFGEVESKLLKKIGIKQAVFYAEFDFESIINALKNVQISTKEITKFPQVKRDLALVLDKSITFDKIKTIVEKTVKKNLTNLTLFDVYENEDQLGVGKKSYAISLTFESLDKTLNDKQVESWMNKLIQTFQSKLGAEIRT